MRRSVLAVALAALVILAGCAGGGTGDVSMDGGDGAQAAGGGSGSIGVSVGGAQDANAFRANVREGYVPQPTDLTYEGLFHDYYFDTDQQRACEETFCPSYSKAVTRDPLSNETERFVTVGLNSGISQADFERDPLNLVVVVDTSGSMSDRFDEYYYDGGQREEVEDNDRKIEAASDAVVSMVDQLNDEDRVGVVAYDDSASTVADLRRVDETDRGELRSSVRELRADGGTSLDAGMREARELIADHAGESERETRVVYVTDAMPNLGDTDGDSLRNRLQGDAEEGIHSTFVGVGVDFNSRLTETISTVRGANYYAVHSPEQFDQRMDEGFSYMVTPLVHNLSLRVESSGYEIEAVYGSPQADRASDQLMEVTTLFPSRREDNRTEGGVVLLEVERTGEDPRLDLVASFEEPDGRQHEVTRTVDFAGVEAPHYDSTGVRKAVALSEYATLLRNWMAHERTGNGEPVAADASVERREYDSQWEQSSVDLSVSPPYDERIPAFVDYFESEQEALGAERMEEDLAILERLAAAAEGSATGTEPTARDRDDPTTVTETVEPTATDDETASADLAAGLGGVSPLGLVNLVVTLCIAGYGVARTRWSSGEKGSDR